MSSEKKRKSKTTSSSQKGGLLDPSLMSQFPIVSKSEIPLPKLSQLQSDGVYNSYADTTHRTAYHQKYTGGSGAGAGDTAKKASTAKKTTRGKKKTTK